MLDFFADSDSKHPGGIHVGACSGDAGRNCARDGGVKNAHGVWFLPSCFGKTCTSVPGNFKDLKPADVAKVITPMCYGKGRCVQN